MWNVDTTIDGRTATSLPVSVDSILLKYGMFASLRVT